MKKTLKKILASVLVAVMVLTAAPLNGFIGLKLNLDWLNFEWLDFAPKASALSSSGQCGNSLYYTFNSSTGLLTISGTGSMYDYDYGYSWKESPFCNNASIKDIIIDMDIIDMDDIRYSCNIGNYAFYGCTGLTSITIPGSVTSIGSCAFQNCTSLTSVYVSGCGFSIDDFAFANCTSLTSVCLSGYDSSIIDDFAFANCTSLTSLKLQGDIISIGEHTFSGCTGLTSITIPDSVTSIGDYAFENCSGLTSITIPDGITSIGEHTFSGCTGLTSITIPDSVTCIGDYAFENCSGLTSITIPDGVTSIGDYAFTYCSGLTSITIPDSVTSIGSWAFENCTGLTKVNIKDIYSWCTISFNYYYSNPLYYAHNLYLNNELITDLVIPDGVTSIGDYAFQYCSDLTSITIPDSVTSIGDFAFYGCTVLTSITIPDSVTSIGRSVFYRCTGLTSITIPDSVTSIGSYAFYGCTGLTSITIPDSVTSIGDYVFGGYTGLRKLTMPCSAKISEYTFYDCSNIEKVTLTKGTGTMQNYSYSTGDTKYNTYYEYTPWYISRNSMKEIVIEDGVTSIGDYAFRGCTGLTSITIPDSVTSIGSDAFFGCTGLTSITIPDSVTSIGWYAFCGCTGLTSITIPDSVTSIGYYAFRNCHLETVIIGDGLTSIPTSLLDPDSLKALELGDRIASIYDRDFAGFGNLEYIVIGNHVKSIGVSAFRDCSSLKNIVVPDSVEVVGDYAFDMCSGLESAVLPNGISKIGYCTFNSCKSLKKVYFSNSVKTIENYAFDDCTSLTDIYFFGTQSDWEKIEIGTKNDKLMSADIHFLGSNHIHDYSYSASVVNPTCTMYGYTIRSCSCGSYLVDGIVSSGHNYGEWTLTKAPTCTVEGVETKYCSRCDVTEIRAVSKTEHPDHNRVETIAPTCLLDGYTTHSCSVCGGDTYADNIVPATGHNYVDGICTNCGWNSELKYSLASQTTNGITTKTATITYYTGSAEELVIPDNIAGVPVVSIGSCSTSTTVKKLVIPDSVTTISGDAFSNCCLETVVIGDGLISLPMNLLKAENLKELVIGDGITSIPSLTFREFTNLKSVDFGNGITYIGVSAFKNCTALESVVLPENLTKLDEYAFNLSSNLKSVKIPLTLTSIGNYAFNSCGIQKVYYDGTQEQWNNIYIGSYNTALTNAAREYNCVEHTHQYLASVTQDATCTETGIKTYTCSCGDTYTEIIPAKGHDYVGVVTEPTCTKQGFTTHVCSRCSNSFVDTYTNPIGHDIVDGVCRHCGSIWKDGFCFTIMIENVNGVETEAAHLTGYTGTETELTVPETINGIPVVCIDEGAFRDCTEVVSIILPDSVKTVESIAFKNCAKLESIDLGSVEKIGVSAFNLCVSLKNVVVPDSVTSLGDYVFNGCSGLESAVLSDNITSIGTYTFNNCGKLKEVTLSNGITSVSDNAFRNCKVMTDVYFYGTSEQWNSISIGSSNNKYFTGANVHYLEKHIHSYSADVTAPTCTEKGYTTYTCECGDSYIADYVPVTEHCYSTWHIKVNPTTTSTGLMVRDCINCGAIAEETIIPCLIPDFVTGITISPKTVVLNDGETADITAIITPDTALNKKLIWSTTDESIVKVENGKVTALNCGSAFIVAETEDGGYKDFCLVRVVSITSTNGSVVDNENGFVYGLSTNTTDINGYVNTVDDSMTVSCNTETIGTGTVISVEKDGKIVDTFKAVIFGDVNGDGWYDGTDAIIVSCLANGMLTKEQVGEAVYMAADCNHDGVIDSADVLILQQAGVLLSQVDQSKSEEELIETSSAYVEYLNLIDQTVGDDNITDNPIEEPYEPSPMPVYQLNIFEKIIAFFMAIWKYIFSFMQF